MQSRQKVASHIADGQDVNHLLFWLCSVLWKAQRHISGKNLPEPGMGNVDGTEPFLFDGLFHLRGKVDSLLPVLVDFQGGQPGGVLLRHGQESGIIYQ